MSKTYRLNAPEREIPFPLGRHVNHDERSRAFGVQPRQGDIHTTLWPVHISALNQTVSSCTGEAGTAWLASDPAWATVGHTLLLGQPYAEQLYSDATIIDPYPGVWPPADTGSDGLSIAKVLKARGLISEYRHAFSLDAALTALMSGPVLIGTSWYDSMFTPNAGGLVRVDTSSGLAGGHEYLAVGYDATRELVRCINSWGTSWSDNGYFWIETNDLERLLADDGDVTVPIPVVTPVHPPAPPVVSTTDHLADVALAEAVRRSVGGPSWVDARHVGSNATAAAAVKRWLLAKGL